MSADSFDLLSHINEFILIVGKHTSTLMTTDRANKAFQCFCCIISYISEDRTIEDAVAAASTRTTLESVHLLAWYVAILFIEFGCDKDKQTVLLHGCTKLLRFVSVGSKFHLAFHESFTKRLLLLLQVGVGSSLQPFNGMTYLTGAAHLLNTIVQGCILQSIHADETVFQDLQILIKYAVAQPSYAVQISLLGIASRFIKAGISLTGEMILFDSSLVGTLVELPTTEMKSLIRYLINKASEGLQGDGSLSEDSTVTCSQLEKAVAGIRVFQLEQTLTCMVNGLIATKGWFNIEQAVISLVGISMQCRELKNHFGEDEIDDDEDRTPFNTDASWDHIVKIESEESTLGIKITINTMICVSPEPIKTWISNKDRCKENINGGKVTLSMEFTSLNLTDFNAIIELMVRLKPSNVPLISSSSTPPPPSSCKQSHKRSAKAAATSSAQATEDSSAGAAALSDVNDIKMSTGSISKTSKIGEATLKSRSGETGNLHEKESAFKSTTADQGRLKMGDGSDGVAIRILSRIAPGDDDKENIQRMFKNQMKKALQEA